MTAYTYPVLCGRVVINSTNNTIIYSEAGITRTATVAAGTYALGSQASDALELLTAVISAMNAVVGKSNSYTGTLMLSADPSALGATVVISINTGSTAFSLQWASASTTFDESLLGYTNTNTSSDTFAKSSTLMPDCLWVGDQPYRSWEPRLEQEAFVSRSVSGGVRGGLLGGPYRSRVLELAFVDDSRTFGEEFSGYVTTQTASNYSGGMLEFIQRYSDGTPILFYTSDILSAFILRVPRDYSQACEGSCWWLLSEDTATEFAPKRMQPGLPLYEFSLTLHAVPA